MSQTASVAEEPKLTQVAAIQPPSAAETSEVKQLATPAEDELGKREAPKPELKEQPVKPQKKIVTM
jgi:hypothetical protein